MYKAEDMFIFKLFKNGTNQGFHKWFAYGCTDRGRKFDKRRDKELLKRLYNIYKKYWPFPLDPFHLIVETLKQTHC